MRRSWGESKLAWRLVRDPRVPPAAKIVPAVVAVYVVSPLDLVPELLSLLGVIDDLAIVALGLGLFRRLAPPHVVAEHERALAAEQRDPDPDRID